MPDEKGIGIRYVSEFDLTEEGSTVVCQCGFTFTAHGHGCTTITANALKAHPCPLTPMHQPSAQGDGAGV